MDVLFHEEQRFRQTWIWVLLIVTLVPVTLLFGVGWVRQVVMGRPFGDKPAPDLALTFVTVFIVVLTLAIFWSIRASRLVTEVRRDGLWIQFFPFQMRPKKVERIRSFAAREYRPVAEYGGWGIRWGGPKNWAYNISGTRGVQLELEDGRRILIGSQRAEELEAALRRL